MLKIVYLFLLSLTLFNCSSFEMVYGDKKNLESLNENTKLEITGDDSSLIRTALKREIGNTKEISKMNLEVSSIKNIRKSITEKNQITTQYEIEYNINYLLTRDDGMCVLANFYNEVKSSYASKSSGFSYGSDVEERETKKDLVNLSINNFFDYVLFHNRLLECKNEG